jgi:hypothetical protein
MRNIRNIKRSRKSSPTRDRERGMPSAVRTLRGESRGQREDMMEESEII